VVEGYAVSIVRYAQVKLPVLIGLARRVYDEDSRVGVIRRYVRLSPSVCLVVSGVSNFVAEIRPAESLLMDVIVA